MRIRRRSAVVPGRIPTPNPLDARVAVAASLVGQERHEVFKALVKEGHDRYVVAPVGLLQRAYGVPEGFDWKLGLDHRMVAVNMRRSRPSWSAPAATRAPATSPPPRSAEPAALRRRTLAGTSHGPQRARRSSRRALPRRRGTPGPARLRLDTILRSAILATMSRLFAANRAWILVVPVERGSVWTADPGTLSMDSCGAKTRIVCQVRVVAIPPRRPVRRREIRLSAARSHQAPRMARATAPGCFT